MNTQAVILAGGLGTRLGPYTQLTPKPLLDVGGRPFLEYLIWNLKRHGISNILLSVGHLSERIVEHFGDGSHVGISIDYTIESEPAGTGGALILAHDKLHPDFLVINGDTLFDINYLDLALIIQGTDASASIALRNVPSARRYGTVLLEDGRITGFFEKGQSGPGHVNGGVYFMRRTVLDTLPPPPCSLEQDFFPNLADKGLLAGKAYDGFFLDIGVPKALKSADRLVPAWKKKRAVFFDRDGVLNKDFGHVYRFEHFEWVDGAPEAIKWCNDLGYLVIVITNQSGIGRGLYTEDHFLNFAQWINDQLRRFGAHIDATYYCPHHPEAALGSYKKVCNCRKPNPGMLLQAMQEWTVDKQKSILIGDKESDIAAGEAVGIRGFLFGEGDLSKFVKKVFAKSMSRCVLKTKARPAYYAK